jgi:hypothetical protein
MHVTTMPYTLDTMDTSSVSVSDFGFEDDKLNNNTDGEPDNNGSDDNNSNDA